MLFVKKIDNSELEKVNIIAEGLEETTCYKFVLKMHTGSQTYSSFCVIKSDYSGNIDFSTDKPIRGSYSEANPMGLFSSLQPTKLQSSNPSANYHLQVFDPSETLIEEAFLNEKKEVVEHVVYKVAVPRDDGPWCKL